MQTLHAVARSTTDASPSLELVVRVASRDVVVGCGLEGRAELGIGREPIVDLGDRTGRLEAADGRARPTAREPVQRRERLAVDDGMGLDHRRETARTPNGDPDRTTQTATELTLDRRAILLRNFELISRACS
jgi:hypothetical protein